MLLGSVVGCNYFHSLKLYPPCVVLLFSQHVGAFRSVYSSYNVSVVQIIVNTGILTYFDCKIVISKTI